MNTGDRINWSYTHRGGYGYTDLVAGIVVKEGPKRVQIEVSEKGLYEKVWRPALKWVDKSKVKPRILPCAVLGGPLELEVQGFQLGAWKHPNGVSSQFPNGTFYGDIDGFQVGAPCWDAERAVHTAYQILLDGGYAVALRTLIECYQGWIDRGSEAKYIAEAEAKLPDLHARLQKVRDAGLDKAAMSNPQPAVGS